MVEGQKEKAPFQINEFQPSLKELIDARERFISLSSWMTTTALAVLGFFLTVLLQIRLKAILPFKTIAVMASVLLTVSSIIGFYIRVRLATQDVIGKLQSGFNSLVGMLAKIISEHEPPIDKMFSPPRRVKALANTRCS